MDYPSFRIAQLQLAYTVKSRRKQLKYTQENLAFAAGIDRSYLSDIERAVANPSLETLTKLAEVLRTTVAQLVARDSKI